MVETDPPKVNVEIGFRAAGQREVAVEHGIPLDVVNELAACVGHAPTLFIIQEVMGLG